MYISAALLVSATVLLVIAIKWMLRGSAMPVQYGYYGSVGGWSLPGEGFSIDAVPRDEMPQFAVEHTDRLDHFWKLMGE